MILIFHLVVFTILLIIVYFRFIRFSKKSLKRRIIREHIKTIKELLKGSSLKELNYYLLGDIRYNEDIIRKVISILKSKGFEVERKESNKFECYLTIK